MTRETSQSLERGLAILSSFRRGRPLLGVRELARELGLSRSTAYRYVTTLAELGYLRQDDASREYRLGPRVLDLGFSAINSMDIHDVAAPFLRQLSDETAATTSMAILDGLDVIYVERFRSARANDHELGLDVHIGSRLPAYCTALGKVLLAHLSDEARADVLRRIDYTLHRPNMPRSAIDLAKELADIHNRGLMIDDDDVPYGWRSIAAPVLAYDGTAVAAISLEARSTRGPTDTLVADLGPQLRHIAEEVSAQLGYRP